MIAPPPYPSRKCWTRAEYEHLIELGVLTTHDHLELIEGEILEKMPQNEPHTTGLLLCTEVVRAIYSRGHVIRIQAPFNVGAKSVPEPDLAIVEGSIRDFSKTHPFRAVLLVEVSDSTLTYDRTTKAKLYARAAVPDYWILNLNERILEVYRKPVGTEYTERTDYDETQSVMLNGQAVAVKELLP